MNRLIPTMCLIIATGLSFAQLYGGDKKREGESPELIAQRELRSNAYEKARQILEADDLREALQAFQEVIEIDARIENLTKSRTSSVHHQIAEIYVRLNQPDEAIRSYRRVFWWDEKRDDLALNGPSWSRVGLDYALLLAGAGRFEEAKAMYYRVLRNTHNSNPVPFPTIVVFEPDDQMIVWEDKPDKLISAIMMLQALEAGGRTAAMEEVLKREPASIIPLVHAKLDLQSHGWLTMARELARTSDEKAWIAMYDQLVIAPQTERGAVYRELSREFGRIQVERCKNSMVLQRAKREMVHMHKRLAD